MLETATSRKNTSLTNVLFPNYGQNTKLNFWTKLKLTVSTSFLYFHVYDYKGLKRCNTVCKRPHYDLSHINLCSFPHLASLYLQIPKVLSALWNLWAIHYSIITSEKKNYNITHYLNTKHLLFTLKYHLQGDKHWYYFNYTLHLQTLKK